MKNFNIDMRIGLGALLCFIASWLVISSPVLSSRLSYWFTENDKGLTENADLARRICSRHHRILYGIFTMAHKSETRAVVRQQTQCGFDNDMSQVVFVVGMPATDKEFETISRWNTICFVENISSSTVQLFLNGTEIFSFPIEENLNVLLQDDIQIGYCRGAAYKGQIADINAWSQPFSPSQIEDFVFGIKPGKINTTC